MKFNPALQKEMEEERGIKKTNDNPETKVELHLYVYQGHLREESETSCVK